MEIPHSLIHRSRSLRYDVRKLSNSAGWRDMVILSAQGANSTWWECEGMSLTHRLNKTGDIIPPSVTPVRMKRLVVGAPWKDDSNVRPCREEQMIFRRYEGKLRSVSLLRRQSTHTISKALATSRKTASVCLFSSEFLDTISTRWASCNAVLCFSLKPNCQRPLTSHRIFVSRIFPNNLPIVSSILMGR